MQENAISLTSWIFPALLVLSAAASPAAAQKTPVQKTSVQTTAAPYPAMAPLDQYLIADSASEVTLARTAAPASVSGPAEVLVLTRDGYKTAAKGSNGFVCMVQRSWANATDAPDFWNPKLRAPICLNAPAVRTFLPILLLKTQWVLAGTSKSDIAQLVEAAFNKKDLPPLEPGAMSYMMSKQQYLGDRDKAWHPHLMWFVPSESMNWGANLADSPMLASEDPEDRMTIFLLTVAQWSDGTPASH